MKDNLDLDALVGRVVGVTVPYTLDASVVDFATGESLDAERTIWVKIDEPSDDGEFAWGRSIHTGLPWAVYPAAINTVMPAGYPNLQR